MKKSFMNNPVTVALCFYIASAFYCASFGARTYNVPDTVASEPNSAVTVKYFNDHSGGSGHRILVQSASTNFYSGSIDAVFDYLSENPSDISVIINSGVYVFQNPPAQVGPGSNISITGLGDVYLEGVLPTGSDRSVFRLQNIDGLHLENLNFYAETDSAQYGSGHAYGVYLNSDGVARDCSFTTKNTIAGIDHVENVVNLPNSGRSMRFENCVFFLANMEPSAVAQQLATHYVATPHVTLEDCDFICRDVDLVFNGNPVSESGNRTNMQTWEWNLDLMNYDSAYSRIPAPYRGLLRESDCLKYSYSNNGKYYISCATTNQFWTPLVSVEVDPKRAGLWAYELDVWGEYWRDDNGQQAVGMGSIRGSWCAHSSFGTYTADIWQPYRPTTDAIFSDVAGSWEFQMLCSEERISRASLIVELKQQYLEFNKNGQAYKPRVRLNIIEEINVPE